MLGGRRTNNSPGGSNATILQLIEQMREQNESLQTQMQEQSTALTATLAALDQGQQVSPARTSQQQTGLDLVALSVTTATANGGTPGYCDKRQLTAEEDDLLTAYTRMGSSIESTHEIICVGPNSIQMLEDLNNEAIGKLVLCINKIESPACQQDYGVPRTLLHY